MLHHKFFSFQTHRWVLQRRLQHSTQYSILGRLPPHLCSLLTPTYSSCSFRSIGWQLFQIPRVFTELGKSVFSYFALSSWHTCQNTPQLTAFISLLGENLKESILVQSEPNDTQMTESWVLTFLWIYLQFKTEITAFGRRRLWWGSDGLAWSKISSFSTGSHFCTSLSSWGSPQKQNSRPNRVLYLCVWAFFFFGFN